MTIQYSSSQRRRIFVRSQARPTVVLGLLITIAIVKYRLPPFHVANIYYNKKQNKNKPLVELLKVRCSEVRQ